MAPSNPKMALGLSWAHLGPSGRSMAIDLPQDCPRWRKMAQRAPTMAQDSSKMTPMRGATGRSLNIFSVLFGTPEMAPKLPQDGLKMLRDGPKMVPTCPNWATITTTQGLPIETITTNIETASSSGDRPVLPLFSPCPRLVMPSFNP